MKKLLILFLSFVSIQAFSQIEENNYYSLNSQYMYDTFVKGEIHFKNGTSTEGELNYNVVVGEFHYVEDGILKTFSDFDLKRISKIIIGQKHFIIKSNTIYEIIYADRISLLKERKVTQEEHSQNEGAYETSSNSSTNKKITTLSIAIGHELQTGALVNFKNEINDIEIHIDETYKILFNNEIYYANKKSFYKIYPDKAEAIKKYIKDEKIKFKTTEEIIKVIEFSEKLKK